MAISGVAGSRVYPAADATEPMGKVEKAIDRVTDEIGKQKPK